MKKPFKQTFGMSEKEYDSKFGKKVHKKPTPAKSPSAKRKLPPLGIIVVVFFSLIGFIGFGVVALASAELYIVGTKPPAGPSTDTTQPTKTNKVTDNSQHTSSTSDGKTPTTPGQVCSTRTIIHGSTTKYVSYLNQGQKNITPGINGTEYSCSTNGGPKHITATIPAFDETVYIGTYVPPTYTPSTPSPATTSPTPIVRTYEQAANYCSGHGVSPNSSAWQLCINAYINQ